MGGWGGGGGGGQARGATGQAWLPGQGREGSGPEMGRHIRSPPALAPNAPTHPTRPPTQPHPPFSALNLCAHTSLRPSKPSLQCRPLTAGQQASPSLHPTANPVMPPCCNAGLGRRMGQLAARPRRRRRQLGRAVGGWGDALLLLEPACTPCRQRGGLCRLGRVLQVHASCLSILHLRVSLPPCVAGPPQGAFRGHKGDHQDVLRGLGEAGVCWEEQVGCVCVWGG